MPEPPLPHADVAGFVLGVLDPSESRDFSDHLSACPACRQEISELAPLRVLLDQGMPAPVLPAGLAERTFAAIEEAAAAPDSGRPEHAQRSRRPRRAALAVAAVAAVAAAATGVVLATSDDDGRREVALLAAGGGNGEGVARLERGVAGVDVELSVTGLPVAPPGSYYECWSVGKSDTLSSPARVTAGTFTVSATGTTTVRMTTAADHTQFPGIEVTLEPDDGDPSRTGPVVLHSRPRPSPATD